MAVQIVHIFKDGTRINGSLQGRGMEMPYNETTKLFYKLCADTLWEQLQQEEKAKIAESS